MQGKAFLKGVGIGMVVGVTATALIAPIDKKKVMKSGAGKAIRAIGDVMESIM